MAYSKVLEEGLEGLRERTHKAYSKLDLTDVADLQKSYFYEAVLLVLEAVEAFALSMHSLRRIWPQVPLPSGLRSCWKFPGYAVRFL